MAAGWRPFLIVSVPYTNPDLVNGAGNASSSPWVIAIKTAGIKVLPSIVNAAIITSAWSAGNTYMYIATRTLRGLALNRQAPRIFSKTTKHGVPIYAVLASIPIGLLAFLSRQMLESATNEQAVAPEALLRRSTGFKPSSLSMSCSTGVWSDFHYS